MKSEVITLAEIAELNKDNILDDTLFARLFYYRDDMDELEFLNLKQSLFLKASELKRKTHFEKKIAWFEKTIQQRNKEKERQARAEHREEQRSYLPKWIDEDNNINEIDFINEFAELYGDVDEQKYFCINGNIYDYKGIIDDEKIRKLIQEKISPYVTRRVADTVSRLLRALKTACTIDRPQLDDTKIHVANGYYSLTDDRFYNSYSFAINRLNVFYNHEYKEPKLWLKYLNELLEIEDIFTLQEYLGYCMIPNKKVQKALYIFGNGGEGKSIIKSVVSAIFQKSCVITNLKDLLEGSFSFATLDNKLIAVDDDAPNSALKDSSKLKTLVTNDDPTQVNPKGRPAYDTVIYAKLLILSNAPIQALYDNSEGFSRRQILLKTKNKPTDRVDDKNLTSKILEELNDIFLWCLEGLKRLISNGYHITISEHSKANLEELKEESNNVFAYVKDTEFIECGDKTKSVTSADLYYNGYMLWCNENAYEPLKKNTVLSYFKKYSSTLKITESNKIENEGKKVRGFKGINLKRKY